MNMSLAAAALAADVNKTTLLIIRAIKRGEVSRGYFRELVRQSRRVVRFLCLRLHCNLFCAGVLSQGQSNHATFADCGGFRDRLSDAAGRRLCFRLRRRQIWPKELDDDLGADDVRWVARHRRTADL